MTPQIDFKALRERVSFEQILSHYSIGLGGAGVQRLAICPFHKDRIASLSVNLERKLFHCFGCGAKGDIFDFVAKRESVPLPEAARIVAGRCGIPISEAQSSLKADQRPKGAPKEVSGTPAPPPKRERAPSDDPAVREEGNKPLRWRLRLDPSHPYLKERGVSPELAETFGLGYCAYGSMKGRICIPIHDENGALVAYAGRWPGTDLPKGEPRYKLPKGFKKSRVVFNLQRGEKAEHLIIVEGYWSVFRLHALGLAAVALMGRTLSAMQEELLACSNARFLTLMLDGDEPGRSAARELLPRLTRNWFVYVAELPDGEQPDTVDMEVFRRILWLP